MVIYNRRIQLLIIFPRNDLQDGVFILKKKDLPQLEDESSISSTLE